MKTLLNLLLIIWFSACHSQNTVIPIRDYAGQMDSNIYIKDTFNDLDLFQGEYLYSNNDTIFRIKLRKVVEANMGKYKEDLIIGELEYKINNVTKINSLADFNTNFQFQAWHKIFGSGILENNEKPECIVCTPNEKRLALSIDDTSYSSRIYLRRSNVNGNSALIAEKISRGPVGVKSGQISKVKIIRDGKFIFIKQP
jgi:hypothetical protein